MTTNTDTQAHGGWAGAVQPGSTWTHHSGRKYHVLFIANYTNHPRDGYPPMVIYEGENGRRWAGRLDDWHRRMTLAASPAAPAPGCRWTAVSEGRGVSDGAPSPSRREEG